MNVPAASLESIIIIGGKKQALRMVIIRDLLISPTEFAARAHILMELQIPRPDPFFCHMPHGQDYSNVVSDCQRAAQENNNTLVTSTLSLAAAQLVTSDNYIESPAVMTALHCHRKKRLSS